MVRSVAIALGSAALVALASGACQDVNVEAENPTCYQNITWAAETGIRDFSQYYNGYALNASSSRIDFQCALYDMVGPNNPGVGHNCTMPCTSTLSQCPPPTPIPAPTPLPTVMPTAAGPDVTPSSPQTEATQTEAAYYTTTEAASSSGSSSSLPWWAWLLLALGLLLALAATAFLAMTGSKKSAAPARKKRALAQAANTREAQVEEATETAPLTTYYMQQPVPAVQTVPVPMAQPVQQLQPMQYVQAVPQPAPQPMTREQAAVLFDQLDTNHLGALSRAQMESFLRAGQV